VTFDDVAGVDEAKEEVKEIVDFLREPERFSSHRRTHSEGRAARRAARDRQDAARAVDRGEAKVPFLFASGSDFVEMYAGVGASRIRKLFKDARRHPACIIFIDELDAVGRSRGGNSLSHEEREQTLNQLLVEMDGFAPNQGIVVVAATNRPDILDPALLRPGRFDRQVTVGAPDLKGREQILKIHARKVALEAEVDLRQIARGTPGFSGAELANLVNEAALYAVRNGRQTITDGDFDHARDKVLMGVERKSLTMSQDERVTCAYHESGHAVVAALLPHADPLHKVTIIPRGRGARRDDAAAGRRSAHAYARIPRGADCDSDGRPGGRRTVPASDDQRRRQRHRARHGNRAPHGLRVRDVGARAAGVSDAGQSVGKPIAAPGSAKRPRNASTNRCARW
jgi:cell division protease FtsH